MKLITTFLGMSSAFSLFGMDKKNPFYAVKPKHELIEAEPESDQMRKMTGPANVFKFQQE